MQLPLVVRSATWMEAMNIKPAVLLCCCERWPALHWWCVLLLLVVLQGICTIQAKEKSSTCRCLEHFHCLHSGSQQNSYIILDAATEHMSALQLHDCC
jgi:hypothetical protein